MPPTKTADPSPTSGVAHLKASVCHVRRLGLVPYLEAWKIQEQIAAEIADGAAPPTLLLLEHPHTFTFGRRGQSSNLLWDRAEQARRGVEVHWVDRGGDVTYHGPGQLIGYPLIPLGKLDPSGRLPQADFVGYIRRIEDCLIRSMARLGLVTGQVRGLTGVWVQPDIASRCVHCPPAARLKPSKIASIGVKVDVHGITRHGFALNVAPDMSYWQGIVPCGLTEFAMISLADLLEPVPSIEDVAEVVAEAFGDVFGYTMASCVG